MSFIAREEAFTCESCKAAVLPLGKGTYRDHCPLCLYSKHVDNDPGDRLASCQGLLKPSGIDTKSGGFVILYECMKCRKKHRNKAAPDDDVVGFLQRESAQTA